jgi:hypothetical protein
MNLLRQYARSLAVGILLGLTILGTLAALGFANQAHAAYVSSFRAAPMRVYVAPRPVYIAPRPVYVRPVVPIFTPRPVIVARPPVIIAPHPIYVAPPVMPYVADAAVAPAYSQPVAVVHSGYGYGSVILYTFLLILLIVILGSGVWFWNPFGFWYVDTAFFDVGYGYDVVDYGVGAAVYE